MGNESGTWIMYGLDREDPRRIRTAEEAVAYINKVGFLPLFKNEVMGFSLEEWTAPGDWWCENPQTDPWIWREIIARGRKVAYGKFFDRKAGFVSLEWLPVFANYRRDGYDFDALYEDGKAPIKHRKIMVNFMEEHAESEILSAELKQMAGYGKEGEKGFDGAITALMMQTYLCNCDFQRRRNKKGLEYGWNVAVYAAPEHLWGYDTVTACYREEPKVSLEKILAHMHMLYPNASDKELRKVLR